MMMMTDTADGDDDEYIAMVSTTTMIVVTMKVKVNMVIIVMVKVMRMVLVMTVVMVMIMMMALNDMMIFRSASVTIGNVRPHGQKEGASANRSKQNKMAPMATHALRTTMPGHRAQDPKTRNPKHKNV